MPVLDIYQEQGTERGLLLQRAADGSHQRAYRIETMRVALSVTVGLAAVIATAFPPAAPAIAIAGATWALLSFSILAVASQRETNAAAVIQEQFDRWLYGLPWPAHAGQTIPDEELRRRARSSTLAQDRMTTWYPDVTGFPDVYAILACQRENLTWDWRLRRRYSAVLVVAAAAWTGIGLLIGLIGDLSVRSLCLRWFVPSSSVLLLALQLARGHREIAAAKEQLAVLVRAELDVARPGGPDPADMPALVERCREVQHGLFALRHRAERVPRQIYERFRNQDEADMQATVSELRARLGL